MFGPLPRLLAQVVNTAPLPHTSANWTTLTVILDIVFGITGSVSLLMIVIGGFRYVIAQGDPGSMSKAKNTIIYAIVGLIVTLVAFSIVTFVVKGVS